MLAICLRALGGTAARRPEGPCSDTCAVSASGARQELASDYARTFLAADTYDERRATPYESVFTSAEGLLMQDGARRRVPPFLRRGLGRGHCRGVRPEDHLSFEFEFMALMCDKANDALARGDVAEAARALRVQRDFRPITS